MEALVETVSALGNPIFMRRIGESPSTIVARWKHGSARIDTNCADAVRVCLSLRGGHTVRHGNLGSESTSIIGGSARVFPADRESTVFIDGQADVVQIFVDPLYLNEIGGGTHVRCDHPDNLNYPALQATAVQLFLGAQGSGPDDDLLVETSRERIYEQLVDSFSPHVVRTSGGKMPNSAIRRIDQLIADRFKADETRAPSIREMARVAQISDSHFIRVFSHSTGVTPHQYVLTRRMELAMGLLAQPHRSVADIADSTGYSSPAHFVSSFRQRLGITPGAYRRAVLT